MRCEKEAKHRYQNVAKILRVVTWIISNKENYNFAIAQMDSLIKLILFPILGAPIIFWAALIYANDCIGHEK